MSILSPLLLLDLILQLLVVETAVSRRIVSCTMLLINELLIKLRTTCSHTRGHVELVVKWRKVISEWRGSKSSNFI